MTTLLLIACSASTVHEQTSAATQQQPPEAEPIAEQNPVATPGTSSTLKTPTSNITGNTAIVREAACQAISDWRPEIIELPPEFAPSLPAGREELRFAPGMFKPDSDTYFSYAFTLSFQDQVALDQAAVESMMDDYFRGLMAAVAQGRKIDIAVDTIKTKITKHGDSFRAEVDLIDAFVTEKPLQLWMTLETDHEASSAAQRPAGETAAPKSCLRVQASSRPYTDPVWAQLAQAATCLPCSL